MTEGSFPRLVDGICYDIALPEDEDDVVDLVVSDFCLTEPLNRSLKVSPEEAALPMRLAIRRVLKDGISLKATDQQTGRLVAARLSSIVDKSKADDVEKEVEDIVKSVPERLRPLMRFVGGEASCGAPDIYSTFNVDRYVEFFAVNVHVDFRGRQVAQRILAFSYELYRTKGLHAVKVLATNPRTAHIFRKQGFQEVASYKVLDYMHEGTPYFEGIEELSVACTFVKDLRT